MIDDINVHDHQHFQNVQFFMLWLFVVGSICSSSVWQVLYSVVLCGRFSMLQFCVVGYICSGSLVGSICSGSVWQAIYALVMRGRFYMMWFFVVGYISSGYVWQVVYDLVLCVRLHMLWFCVICYICSGFVWQVLYAVVLCDGLYMLMVLCGRFCSSGRSPRPSGGSSGAGPRVLPVGPLSPLLRHVCPVRHCRLCVQTRTGKQTLNPLTFNLCPDCCRCV